MIGQAREHAALFVLDDEGEVAWRRGVERGRRAAVGVGIPEVRIDIFADVSHLGYVLVVVGG